MAGFGVLITFGFFIYIVSWDRSQLVGLGIPLRFIAKPSYARHCTNPNVAGNAVGHMGQLTSNYKWEYLKEMDELTLKD